MTSMTRRNLLRAGALGGLAMTAAGCGFATKTAGPDPVAATPSIRPKIDGDLVYFNWADYIDPALFKGFSKEYGVKVRETNFDSMEAMAAKLVAGNRYDLIFPTARWVEKLVTARQLHPLPLDKLTGYANIYAEFQDPWYDKNSVHSVPYQMYKTGIGWRKDKLGQLSGSWNDLWNDTAKGRTFLLDDRDEVIGAMALLVGLDVNVTDRAGLDRIEAKARTLRPMLRGFSTDDRNNMLNGNAWLHHMWSGDFLAVVQAAKNPDQLAFEVCKEGVPINSDCYAIPRNAEHPGTALLFIDYLLRPENAIKNLEYIGYPQPHKGTEQAFADLTGDFPQLRVTPEELAAGQSFHNVSRPESRLRDAAWTRIKAA